MTSVVECARFHVMFQNFDLTSVDGFCGLDWTPLVYVSIGQPVSYRYTRVHTLLRFVPVCISGGCLHLWQILCASFVKVRHDAALAGCIGMKLLRRLRGLCSLCFTMEGKSGAVVNSAAMTSAIF